MLSWRPAEAELRLGVEIRVNSFTTESQFGPAIASDTAGNFVVVWHSNGQFGSYSIFGQRYASSGALLGVEFRVNSYTTNGQAFPAIATDSAGNFVVVWHSIGPDGSGYGIFGQRYAGSGAPLGTEFQVNSYTTSNQMFPTIASDPAGDFVVVWHSNGPDGSAYGVFGQRYAGSGARLGNEFQINSYATSSQSFPVAASDSTGNFVVVWQSYTQDGSAYGIFGQRYASSGSRLGNEFQVNSNTSGYQANPAVASDQAGNFAVVWRSGSIVFGQRYASSGARLGNEIPVSTGIENRDPSIALGPAGTFVVAWTNYPTPDNYGVAGQRYASSGTPLGSQFQVNTYTPYSQVASAIASDSAGNFTVVWQSRNQDGSNWGVFSQRYCPQSLSAVSVSTTGSLSVCPSSTGGTATVTDTGGTTNIHQWFYRTSPMGAPNPISGQTAVTYLIKGSDFGMPPGTPGFYYLGCFTTPSCGSQMFSSETIVVTVSTDGTSPAVAPPPSIKTTQSLCQ